MPAVGEIIGGKYRIDRLVGEGSMGAVLAAEHLSLLQPVAIKVLTLEANEQTVERFLREARAAARIPSEHVAAVFDVDRLPSGQPYMVMELLSGTDLAGLLVERGALPASEAVDYIIQACEAVGHAHDLGIVHRDLKPGNLFSGPERARPPVRQSP